MLFKNKIDKFFSKINKSWLFKKITDDWVFGEVILLALIAIGIYAINFHDYGLSKKTADWADFATYLSGTVGVAAVTATLVVLVRTLTEQRELINLEKNKSQELVEQKGKGQRYTAIYLIHRFSKMDNFYNHAIPALESKKPETWKAIASQHLAFYDSYLMNEQGELIFLLEKMDSNMALNCIGAVDAYREVFAVMKTALSNEAISQDNNHVIRREINRLSDQRRTDTIELARQGRKYCNEFLNGANEMLEQEKSI